MLINLPFTKEKKQKITPYYAVELSDEMVKVAVWQVDEGVVSVIRTSDVIQITGSKMDDYLQAVDMAIATVTVDGEPDPKEVLYGLPPEWVDESGVVAARRSLLKYISEKMMLKPIGFVMIIDALIEYLRLKQSTPPSALFIRFRKQMLDVYLVTLGKVIKAESVGRSNDIVADVKEALVRLKEKGQLPPRLMLFDGYVDFSDITQQLMNVAWENELPFTHTPAVESLNRDMTVEAVALAAGKEAAKQTDPEVTVSIKQAAVDTASVSQPAETSQAAPDVTLPPGFSMGLPGATDTSLPKTENLTDMQDEVSQMPDREAVVPTDLHHELEIEASDSTPVEAASSRIDIMSKMTNIKRRFSMIALKNPFKRSSQVPDLEDTQPSMADDIPSASRKLPWWTWLVGGLILLIGLGSAGAWAYQTQPKADVIVGIRSQVVDQDVTFTISQSQDSMDEEHLILPAKQVSASASGSQTVPTTGTKRVGKSATGKVTVYNKTEKPKSFPKGTVLVGPGNLRYELSAEVKLASKSAVSTGEGETVTFGKSDVSIAAADIGEEYNQAVGKDFRFKDSSSDDYSAKNGEEISGGESSEKKAVSKDDRTNLKDLLTQTLQTQATQQLNKELGGTLMVIDKTQQTELEEIRYDKKAGDEAVELTGEGSVQMKALAVNKDDYQRILLKALAAQIPGNYQVTAAGLQSQITNVEIIEETEEKKSSKNKESDEPKKYSISVKAQVKIMPKLDFAQIKTAVKGKTPQIADEYVRTLPGYNSHRISIHPNLPGPLGTMPQKPERIAIVVEEVQ